jgi:hypothetical protein
MSISQEIWPSQSLSSSSKCRFGNIKFCVSVRNNRLLTYKDNYSARQLAMYKVICFMKGEGMSWRKISAWLNRSGIKTHRGNTWAEAGASAHSVFKRMHQRIERIEQIKHKRFSIEVSDFTFEK